LILKQFEIIRRWMKLNSIKKRKEKTETKRIITRFDIKIK
jgi:hypothetical protein